MKIYKATIYFFDPNADDDYYTTEEAVNNLEFTLARDNCFCHQLFDVKTAVAGEWHDDIDLNQQGATMKTYENYFRRIR